ncbi:unnamed protein product [Brassicogethes aeneus]|uniref:Osiris 2 n=1 Tax=Brassicogethes aeneus TaxID=1431903 RepID=A0A9P0FI37_BRAAE|nr:unnamed protein product [Brassicogethes aeneus]
MLSLAKWSLLAAGVSLLALQSICQNVLPQDQQDPRQGRDLLDWIGLGTGPETDPYLAKTNAACLNGDLAECFKSRALSSLDEFFNKPFYHLTENAKILRMPVNQLREIAQEPYEFSQSPRSDEPEWDQLVKFALRKVEKFLKSSAIEVDIDNDVSENGRYSPRFIDEIADEIDTIEDKKDTFIKRKQLKKLFIPMLIILKLFKLKLLLFLPLILGLASFKKLLGLLAIVIPGLIGFFKLCKPNLQSGFTGNYFNQGPHYSPAGIAYQPHYKEQPSFVHQEYPEHYHHGHGGGGVHFRDEHQAQDLAYNGWNQYRSNEKDIEAEGETTSKKSILPDN